MIGSGRGEGGGGRDREGDLQRTSEKNLPEDEPNIDGLDDRRGISSPCTREDVKEEEDDPPILHFDDDSMFVNLSERMTRIRSDFWGKFGKVRGCATQSDVGRRRDGGHAD